MCCDSTFPTEDSITHVGIFEERQGELQAQTIRQELIAQARSYSRVDEEYGVRHRLDIAANVQHLPVPRFANPTELPLASPAPRRSEYCTI